MWIIALVLILLGAQFSLTAFSPANAGKAWLLWPFSGGSRPWLGLIGGLPQQSGSVVTPLLAGVAGLCFFAALAGLFGWLVPPEWWRPLVLIASTASLLLFVLYLNPLAIPPILVDMILLWGMLVQNWSVPQLRGG